MSYINIKIKFDHNKTYTPLLKTDYIIKINEHPKKGNLIDLYTALPNPILINKVFTEKDVTYIYNSDRFGCKVFVGRHWPKQINEEHMLILLPYNIDVREKYFKGERLTHPIGNYKIVEKGDLYLLSFFKQAHMFIFIVYLQRKLGILPISQGSVYAIYLDITKEFSTSNILKWVREPLYLRNQRIYTGKPKLDIKTTKMIDPTHSLQYF